MNNKKDSKFESGFEHTIPSLLSHLATYSRCTQRLPYDRWLPRHFSFCPEYSTTVACCSPSPSGKLRFVNEKLSPLSFSCSVDWLAENHTHINSDNRLVEKKESRSVNSALFLLSIGYDFFWYLSLIEDSLPARLTVFAYVEMSLQYSYKITQGAIKVRATEYRIQKFYCL